MKLLLILFSAVTITTAFVEDLDRQMIYDLLDGKTVVVGPVEAASEVGDLPDPYPNLTEDDKRATANAKKLLESARALFQVGYGPIPPLDPYKPVVDPIPLSFLEPLASGTLNLNGLTVTGLQQFQTLQLTLRLNEKDEGTREDAAFSLPTLRAKGGFAADLLLEDVIPLRLTGQFAAQLTDIKLTAAAGTNMQTTGHIVRVQVDALKADARVAKVQMKVQFDDLAAAHLIKDALRIFPNQSYLENLEKELGEAVLNVVIKEINLVLSSLTVEEIQHLLLPPAIDY